MNKRVISYICSLILIGIVVVSSYITIYTSIYFSDDNRTASTSLCTKPDDDSMTTMFYSCWNSDWERRKSIAFGHEEVEIYQTNPLVADTDSQKLDYYQSTSDNVNDFGDFVLETDGTVTSSNYGTSLEFSYHSSMGGTNTYEQDGYYLFFNDFEGDFEVNVTTGWSIDSTLCTWHFYFDLFDYEGIIDTANLKAGLHVEDSWLANTGRFNIAGDTTIYYGVFGEVGLSRSNVVFSIKRVDNTTHYLITQGATILKSLSLFETLGVVNCLCIAWDHSPYYSSETSTFTCLDLQGTFVEISTVYPPINITTVVNDSTDKWAKIFGLYLLPVYFTIIIVPILVLSIKFARKRTQEREVKEKIHVTFESGYSFSLETSDGEIDEESTE